jgi:hypothetical protein
MCTAIICATGRGVVRGLNKLYLKSHTLQTHYFNQQANEKFFFFFKHQQTTRKLTYLWAPLNDFRRSSYVSPHYWKRLEEVAGHFNLAACVVIYMHYDYASAYAHNTVCMYFLSVDVRTQQ